VIPQQSRGGFKHRLRPIRLAFHGIALGKQPSQEAVIVAKRSSQSDPSDHYEVHTAASFEQQRMPFQTLKLSPSDRGNATVRSDEFQPNDERF